MSQLCSVVVATFTILLLLGLKVIMNLREEMLKHVVFGALCPAPVIFDCTCVNQEKQLSYFEVLTQPH